MTFARQRSAYQRGHTLGTSSVRRAPVRVFGLVAAAAVAAGSAAIAFSPAGAEPLPVNSSQASGRVCVFYAPGVYLNVETGHVGWAVKKPGTDQWVLGSADGGNDGRGSSTASSGSTTSAGGSSSGESNASSAHNSQSDSAGSSTRSSGSATTGIPGVAPADAGVPRYPADLPEKVWVTRSSSFADVVTDFDSFGWYSTYRCKNTDGGDSEATYRFAAGDGNFTIVDNNCLHHAWSALNTYEPGQLTPAPLFPSSWFANLGTTDGFEAIKKMPHPVTDPGDSIPQSGHTA